MRQPDERDLRTALREEADRHHPDRQAMLDRIAEGRGAPARRPMNRVLVLLRPMAAAVAVAVLLVLAVAGVRLGNRGPEVDDTPVAAPPAVPTTPAPAAAASTAVTPTGRAPEPDGPTADPTTPRAPRTSTGPSSPAPRTTPPSSAPVAARDGYLSSTGEVDPNSNPGWTQDTVWLETTRPLTALDVTIEVSLTDGVVETGKFSTVAGNMITVTSSRTDRALVFRFVLQPGFRLPPGKYRFAGQFNHAVGRQPGADDVYAAGTTGEGKDAKVSGGFTRGR